MNKKIKREYMLQKFLKDHSDKSVDTYYNFDLRKKENNYCFIMCQHWTYSMFVGEGKDEIEAVKNIKYITCCYNHEEYKKLKEYLDSFEEVSFEYKPEEIVEFKSYSIVGSEPIDSEYTFCDFEEAVKFFTCNKNNTHHYKILQKVNKKWVDVTNNY
jgi:hypothetical protein